MFNQPHHFVRFTGFHLYVPFLLLGCTLSLMTLSLGVHAQEAANDPVANVEVSATSVWRDGVTRGNITVICTNASGTPVPNAPVSISIGYPGTIYSPPNGNGTTDNYGNVTVEVTSIDFTAEFDDAVATLTATSEGASGTGLVFFRGPLEISGNNPAMTGATTACQVGEPENLSATVLSDVNIKDISWSAAGATPIGGWNGGSSPAFTTTTPFPPSGNDTASVPLYLTTTGSSTVTVTATDTDAAGNLVATGDANTYFTVSKPKDFTLNAQQLGAADGNLAVGLGTADPDSPIEGINFTRSGGAGGTLSFAQIVNTNKFTYIDDSGPNNMTKPNLPGLDNSFPYPDAVSPANTTNDSPHRNLAYSNGVSTHITELNVTSWSATMYLMWQSNKIGSIPIPVEKIDWSWNADAKFDPTTGSPTSFSGSKSVNYPNGTAIDNGVLTWTQTSHNKDSSIPAN